MSRLVQYPLREGCVGRNGWAVVGLFVTKPEIWNPTLPLELQLIQADAGPLRKNLLWTTVVWYFDSKGAFRLELLEEVEVEVAAVRVDILTFTLAAGGAARAAAAVNTTVGAVDGVNTFAMTISV